MLTQLWTISLTVTMMICFCLDPILRFFTITSYLFTPDWIFASVIYTFPSDFSLKLPSCVWWLQTQDYGIWALRPLLHLMFIQRFGADPPMRSTASNWFSSISPAPAPDYNTHQCKLDGEVLPHRWKAHQLALFFSLMPVTDVII